jgi:hypothetical protein
VAIGTPVDRGGAAAGGTTSATSASFTPTANSLLIAKATTKATSAPGTPSISDSLGGTWTTISAAVDGPASNPFIKGRLAYQVVGASPAAMTVSATGGTTSTEIEVIEITGAGTDFSNINIATSTTGVPSFSLPNAPTATGAVILFYTAHLSAVVTQPTGYTELYDRNHTGSTNHRCEFAYDLTSPAQTGSWSSTTNTNSVAVALEIKEPVIAAASLLTPNSLAHLLVR